MNFYRSAALALDHLDKNQGSVKGSLAAAHVKATPGEAKRILALIIETLKYRDTLTKLLESVNLMKLEKETFRYKGSPSSKNLILVLLHDLLFSPKGKIEASDKWPPKPAVARHQARFRAELVRLQLKAGAKSVRDLGRAANSAVEARYVRWNPNVDACRSDDWSLPALHAHLASRGMKLLDSPQWPIPADGYFMDEHMPAYLLVFHPSSTWWVGDKWYEAGAVVLQDKASCMPAAIVMDGWTAGEGECIDGTAAPGNKTSLMSALMGDGGSIHAFEKSALRYKTLTRMLDTAACKNVNATRGDFTETNPADYPLVTRILLDPSCSGSGIVNRLDYLVDGDEAEADDQADRLEKLAAFQLQMVQHAFRFPNVQRVVYSTCSIHPEEDERVVAKALAAGRGSWRMAPRASVLPTWERRGREEELGDDAECVIRCLPEDRTNGFFVSCFERVQEGEPKWKAGKGGKAKGEVKAKAKGGKGAKRPREEEEEEEPAAEVAVEVTEEVEMAEVQEPATPKGPKGPKTDAQAERARRKKKLQQQKKRKTAA